MVSLTMGKSDTITQAQLLWENREKQRATLRNWFIKLGPLDLLPRTTQYGIYGITAYGETALKIISKQIYC